MKENIQHWDNIYRSKESSELGWYQESPDISLQLIRKYAPQKPYSIVDIGCGVSKLVDHLLDSQLTDITLLDISSAALETVSARLGDKGKTVNYLTGDITQINFDRHFDIWHDRAVFHFLTDENAQQAYMENLAKSLSPTGSAIIGTFSFDGPNKCSGLDVVQYDDEKMNAVIGTNFTLKHSQQNTHTMPSGRQQDYRYFVVKLS